MHTKCSLFFFLLLPTPCCPQSPLGPGPRKAGGPYTPRAGQGLLMPPVLGFSPLNPEGDILKWKCFSKQCAGYPAPHSRRRPSPQLCQLLSKSLLLRRCTGKARRHLSTSTWPPTYLCGHHTHHHWEQTAHQPATSTDSVLIGRCLFLHPPGRGPWTPIFRGTFRGKTISLDSASSVQGVRSRPHCSP